MVGRLFHGADVVVDAGGAAGLLERTGEEDVVDAQAPLGLGLEAAAAVVEPAEAVVDVGVEFTVAVVQPPVAQGGEPGPLFGEEAGLAGAEPALGVVGADADVRVHGGDVEVSHDRQGGVGVAGGFQVGEHVGVEAFLGRELDRVVAAFALGEVAVDDPQGRPGGEVEGGADEALLGLVAVAGEAEPDVAGRLEGEERHAVVGLLAVVDHVIAQGLHGGQGEVGILHLGFLEADDVGPMGQIGRAHV